MTAGLGGSGLGAGSGCRHYPRVVSLVPSVTETLLAWGLTPTAVTRFCEQPGLPAVGGTKNPDVAAIVALRPDVVVVDKEENRAEDAAALDAAGVALLVLHVCSVADVSRELDRLASAVGIQRPPTPAPRPTTPAPRPMQAATTPAPSPSVQPTPPSVRAWIPIWRRPWMTINGDTYGSSLLEVVGVTNVFADAEERYPTVTLDDAAARKPDVVLAPSEPYPFSARQQKELETVAPVKFIDGKDLFWWGVRTSEALRRLAALNLPREGSSGKGT